MSPIDRISQLADENAILRTQLRDAREQAKRDTGTIALLRSQLHDAQEQAKRDTETIARLRAMPCAPTHETELRLRNTPPLENPTLCTP